MALDEKLNQRIRDIVSERKGVTETKMFGGLCFMHNGNMMCGGDLKYGFSVRVGPEAYEEALKLNHAREMDLTGVPLKGLVFVASEGIRTKTMLTKWIDRGMAFTETLPPKKKKKKAVRKRSK
jgi:hypothetical protein